MRKRDTRESLLAMLGVLVRMLRRWQQGRRGRRLRGEAFKRRRVAKWQEISRWMGCNSKLPNREAAGAILAIGEFQGRMGLKTSGGLLIIQ